MVSRVVLVGTAPSSRITCHWVTRPVLTFQPGTVVYFMLGSVASSRLDLTAHKRARIVAAKYGANVEDYGVELYRTRGVLHDNRCDACGTSDDPRGR